MEFLCISGAIALFITVTNYIITELPKFQNQPQVEVTSE